ncbi:MAG: type II toxin-antitoxin system RelE/ParE family toxin [Candidatus Bathyarchaeota archaeon]|nr:type II toxin-antitoxin system RelE/ParE family toxin [Candidatus Bathyarchaeota archaeon]
MPKFRVIAHRRVHKFLTELENEKIKSRIKHIINSLGDYPLALKEMDVEKVKGLTGAFRIRVGTYRIIFVADKDEKTIYVTHVESRKRAYKS